MDFFLRKRVIVFIILTLFFLCPYAKNHFTNDLLQEPPTAYNWPLSTPEAHGLDESLLTKAFDRVRECDFLNGYLIIRNGYLVAEWYNRDFDKNDYHPVYSITKSFTSTLIGIAIQEKFIESVDQKLLEFFPEYVDQIVDQRISQVTIAHLLTMTSGVNGPTDSVNVSTDWIGDTIRRPLLFNSGDEYQYTDYGAHLLSGIITTATGMSTLAFARNHLLDPLGIKIILWSIDPAGYFTGGYGIYMTPRDMARLGYLFLNKGSIDGIQIVPSEWVKASIQYHVRLYPEWGCLKDIGYGFLWNLGKMAGYSYFSAMGYGGQMIFIIPDLEMIIVTVSSTQSKHPQTHNRILLEWIFQYIMPAIG